MGAWRPKHVEWLCRNKTCTVLHQVGVSFDLPHSRSTGWVLFSRFGCPMSSKGRSKGLGCVSSFLWCFAYFSNMTSRTYGTFKSSCRVKLDTYRGASVIMRRIFDCAFCSTAWLDLLAQPQSCILYDMFQTLPESHYQTRYKHLYQDSLCTAPRNLKRPGSEPWNMYCVLKIYIE